MLSCTDLFYLVHWEFNSIWTVSTVKPGNSITWAGFNNEFFWFARHCRYDNRHQWELPLSPFLCLIFALAHLVRPVGMASPRVGKTGLYPCPFRNVCWSPSLEKMKVSAPVSCLRCSSHLQFSWLVKSPISALWLAP